jgi:hypothetical protein
LPLIDGPLHVPYLSGRQAGRLSGPTRCQDNNFVSSFSHTARFLKSQEGGTVDGIEQNVYKRLSASGLWTDVSGLWTGSMTFWSHLEAGAFPA